MGAESRRRRRRRGLSRGARAPARQEQGARRRAGRRERPRGGRAGQRASGRRRRSTRAGPARPRGDARRARHARGARVRGGLQDRQRARAGGRAARQDRVPRGSGRQARRGPRRDRSAAVPDPAASGPGGARARRGAAPRRRARPREVSSGRHEAAHPAAAGRRPARDRRAAAGPPPGRRGADRERPPAARLRAHQVAHRRRHRRAPGRSGQHRPRRRRDRHRRRHRARSHRRALHAPRGRPAAHRRGAAGGSARRRGVVARRRAPMSISAPFIKRPVGTALLMVGVLIGGIVGYRQLPVSALPQVDYPTIVVSTLLPGASADTMVSAVTTPLERQLGQIPSLAQLTSVSSAASSQITLQFNLDRNIDAAEQDLQPAINEASNLLPRTLPTPPTYSKSNPADVPVISFSVSSDTVPLSQVDDYADSIFAQKLSQVSGVGLVTLNGGQRPAVRVQVDPEALAGRGLSLEDVRTVLVAANVNQPKGNLDGPRQNYTVTANDQLGDAKGYAPLVVAYIGGAAVRLSDVAKVVDGVENDQ